MTHGRNIYIPSIISAAYAFLMSFAMFFLPVYLKNELGFSGAQIGLLFGIYGITAVVVVFPSGLSTDVITPRRILMYSLILTIISGVGLAFFRSFPAYMAVFILFGISGNSTKVAIESFLFKTHKRAHKGETFGIYQGIRMLGFMAAMLMGGYLLGRIDFQLTIFAMTAIIVPMLLLVFFLPDVPVAWSKLSLYMSDLREKRVILFAVWLFLFTSHWGAESTCYGLFVRENLGLSMQKMGLFMSGEFIVFALTAWLMGRRYDHGKADLGRILLAGILLSGVGHVFMVYPFWPTSLAFRLLHGIGDGLVTVAMFVGISKLFLRERIGGNSGVVNLVAMGGVLTGSMIYGPVGEAYGYHIPLLASGLIMLVLAMFPQLWHRIGHAGGEH